MDRDVLYQLINMTWMQATGKVTLTPPEVADSLINKAFASAVHTYPVPSEKYGKQNPDFATAWAILDTVTPGVLSSSARALLAGAIVGALYKERQKVRERQHE